MLESDLDTLCEMLKRCDDVADKLDFFKLDHQGWRANPYVRDSFLVSVSQIGELYAHTTAGICRDLFPNIPWKQVKALRNIIVHAYVDVDYERIWEYINSDIPELRETLLTNEIVRERYQSDSEILENSLDDLYENYLGQHPNALSQCSCSAKDVENR